MKMALKLDHLDDITRKYMVEEIQGDVSEGKVYISSRLNDAVKIKFPELLIASAKSGNDSLKGYFNEKESNGKGSCRSIPDNANVTLAEGEYNRYYIRALCVRAIIENKEIIEQIKAFIDKKYTEQLKNIRHDMYFIQSVSALHTKTFDYLI